MAVSRDAVLSALEGVIDPELKRSVVELDMVRDVRVDGGDVSVTIALTVPGCPLRASFEEQVEEALRPVEGIRSVALGFDVLTPEERQALTAKLAAAFSRLGHATGVLDADVYGYSIPTMLGISQRPVAVDKMIVPPVRGDLKVMSIGFFLDENSPVMWRGPMLHRALEQFLSDVHWGELDTLVVDMPPGTGDVAISLGQLLPRAEAVVVTTPHRAAQQVAVRAAQMARKTNMRLLGVVENMSFQVGTGEE